MALKYRRNLRKEERRKAYAKSPAMNNQYFSNRVEADLTRWRSREERLNKLFSFPLSSNRALLKEKLEYYERVAAKYKGTSNLDERLALSMLREECRQMEKQIYPNLLTRLLRRILVTPAATQNIIRQDNKKIRENSQALHQQVQRAGFPDLSSKIDEQIWQGQQQFSIPVSYYLNDKERLDHQLSFAKDQSGWYRFEGFKANLYDESKPDEKRQQYFSMHRGCNVNTTEAYNLLSGRCVQSGDTWMQLDFNDKDTQGNCRIKQFHPRYGYNLEKVLQQLPLKELLDKEEADKLQKGLKDGNRISVSFLKDGKEQQFYIEANPQFKSVNIYDEHYRKITLHTASGNKTTDAMKVMHKIKKEQQSHAKRKGVKIG